MTNSALRIAGGWEELSFGDRVSRVIKEMGQHVLSIMEGLFKYVQEIRTTSLKVPGGYIWN